MGQELRKAESKQSHDPTWGRTGPIQEPEGSLTTAADSRERNGPNTALVRSEEGHSGLCILIFTFWCHIREST